MAKSSRRKARAKSKRRLTAAQVRKLLGGRRGLALGKAEVQFIRSSTTGRIFVFTRLVDDTGVPNEFLNIQEYVNPKSGLPTNQMDDLTKMQTWLDLRALLESKQSQPSEGMHPMDAGAILDLLRSRGFKLK